MATTESESNLQIAQRLIIEGRAESEAITAYALVSIAENLKRLLGEMDNSKCGHGVVTLFAPCQSCVLMNS